MDMDTNIPSAAQNQNQNRTLNLQPKYLGKNIASGKFSGSTLRAPGPDPKNWEASPLPPRSVATTSSKLLSQKDVGNGIGEEDADVLVLVSRPVVGSPNGESDDNEHPLYASGSTALEQWVSSSVQSSASGGSGRSTPSRSTGTSSSNEWAQNTRQTSSNHGNHFSSAHLTMIGMHKVDPDYRRLMNRNAACNDPETENWE